MANGTKELKKELVWAKGLMMELELTEQIRFVNGVTLELGRNKKWMWPVFIYEPWWILRDIDDSL